MRISDWSSDVCSSDLLGRAIRAYDAGAAIETAAGVDGDQSDWRLADRPRCMVSLLRFSRRVHAPGRAHRRVRLSAGNAWRESPRFAACAIPRSAATARRTREPAGVRVVYDGIATIARAW